MASKRPQLHVSSIKSMLECPEQFRRRYIEGDTPLSSIVQVVGLAVDAAATHCMTVKLSNLALPPLHDCLEIARARVHSAFQKPLRYTIPEKTQLKEALRREAVMKAERLVEVYRRDLAPKLEPISVQKSFSISLDKFLETRHLDYKLDLVGTMDLTEADTIRDLKTAGKKPAATIANSSRQLTGYSLAWYFEHQKLPEHVALDYLVDTKTPYLETFYSTRDMRDIATILDDIELVVRKIKDGVFTATPNKMACFPCNFRSTCPYAVKTKAEQEKIDASNRQDSES